MRTNKVCRRCDGCVRAHTLTPLVTDTFKAEGWKCRVKFQIYFELAEIQGDLWTRAQSSCCHNWEPHFLEHMRHSVQGKHLLFCFCFLFSFLPFDGLLSRKSTSLTLLIHLSPDHTLHCWLRPEPPRIMSFSQRRLPNRSVYWRRRFRYVHQSQLCKFLDFWQHENAHISCTSLKKESIIWI